jgi:hypothetical protein
LVDVATFLPMVIGYSDYSNSAIGYSDYSYYCQYSLPWKQLVSVVFVGYLGDLFLTIVILIIIVSVGSGLKLFLQTQDTRG